MNTRLEAIEAMIEATSVADVWEIYLREVAACGFPRVLYAYSRDQQGDPFGLDHALYLSNHEQAYLDVFLGEELYRDAPMVRWVAENDGTMSWRKVAEAYAAGTLSAAERKVVEFNRSMGITAGISISFTDVSVRARGGVGLVGAPGVSQDEVDANFARERRYLITISNLLHLKATALPRQRPSALTQRQREALEWVAEGKTMQDVALLMGISTAMVEKHLRLARNALDVDTTAHAIAKAARLQQIFVADS